MQRRLAALVAAGRIEALGHRGGRRYLVVESERKGHRQAASVVDAKGVVALSSAAREVRFLAIRPVSVRVPVGYNADFLHDYLPNDTYYLDAAVRAQLARIGQAGEADLPAGSYIRKVMDRLIIDLSWSSSRLEGNTYSLLETQRLLELGEGAEGKDAAEAQMILNHRAAIELLADQAGEVGFNRFTLCSLHALLSDNLMEDPGACGRLRDRPVAITGSVFYPLEVPQLVKQYFDEMLNLAGRIEDAFEQAFFIMVHLPYLQPFEDVNKRVSRLAANIPLVRRNLCPLSFIDVPQNDYLNGTMAVYELNRIEYLRDVFVWAYQRSCARLSAVRQSLGNPDPFRLKYRVQIGKTVAEVVRGGMDKRQAVRWIKVQAESGLPDDDAGRFIDVVETELSCLHKGNIARFRLRPSEYQQWQEGWH